MRPEEQEDLIARYLGDALSEEEERKLLDLVERARTLGADAAR